MHSSSRGFLSRRLRTAGAAGIAGAPLVAMSCALLWLRALDRHVVWTVAVLACGFLWQMLSVTALESSERRRSDAARPHYRAILVVAILMRLPLLALAPTLSDDVLRYVWDGRVAAAGQNPYALAPQATELTELRDPLWQRLPHREVPTVYPPAAIGLFSIAARSAAPVLTLKVLLTVADLVLIAMLAALARRRGLPASRVGWYAWSPLAAIEIAGMGHIDALGAAAVVGVVLALSPRPTDAEGGPRPVHAAISAALAVLAKLIPVAAIPMWARQSRRPALFALYALGTVAVAVLPVLTATGGIPPGLVTYGVSWEFNGPVYEPLWRSVETLRLDGAVHGALDLVKTLPGLARHDGWHRAVNQLYPHAHPRLLAKLLLALLAGAVVWRSVRQDDPVAGSRDLFGGLLLASATVYPWYALWLLPFAALTRSAPWLTLAALLPLSYLPQFLPGLELFPWVWAAIWGPVAAVWLVGQRGTRRSPP